MYQRGFETFLQKLLCTYVKPPERAISPKQRGRMHHYG
jgi:hypothetical protein